MPGTIGAPMPTLVMPQQLCTAFSESRNYEQRRNEFHDGTPLAGQLAQTSRRTWKLSRRLSALQLATLRTFWENVAGGLNPFLFYNPYEGSPVGSNYDATGVNLVGRYVVAFRNNWQQVTGLGRTDASQFELIELDAMDPEYAAAAGFGPHGAIVSAVLYATTAHIPNPSNTPFPGVEFSTDGFLGIGGADWLNSNAAWAERTDSKGINYQSWPGLVLIGINTNITVNGGNPISPTDQLQVYEVWGVVTFADGHATTIRPTQVTTIVNSQGDVMNPQNAIDGNATTYALVERTQFTALSSGTYLRCSSFTGIA